MVAALVAYLLAALLLLGHHWPWLGVLCGLFWITFNRIADDKGNSFLTYFSAAAGLIGALPGLAWFALPPISQGILEYRLTAPVADLWIWAGYASFSAVIFFLVFRLGAQFADGLFDRLTVKSSLERNRKTDVREIHKFLPREISAFNPEKYAKQSRGMFVGLDEQMKPVYLDRDVWKTSHILLSGRTRSGKGVAAQILLTQAIERGEYVVVLDPKVDNWMPHVFKRAADRAGLPYVFLDLRQSAPSQFNLFAGCDEETLENMLVGGFSLTERGSDADFYRLADRKAARQAARWLASNPGKTAADIMLAFGEQWADVAPAFHSYMLEMAELPAVNCQYGGVDIAAGEQTGGALYVVGDMINPRIIRMQRMILLRLLFLAKSRQGINRQHRTITVFADEFKVHISRPFMTALGASAGWGLHTILAFQSLQDLADCPADLDKESVRGAVMENCAIQLSYAIKDPDTAEWLSASTGKVLVDDESRRVSKNIALSETVSAERTLRQAERNLVDTNMLMNLPKGCGVLSVAGRLAEFCYTSPIPAKETEGAIAVTVSDVSRNTPKTCSIETIQRGLAASALDLDDESLVTKFNDVRGA